MHLSHRLIAFIPVVTIIQSISTLALEPPQIYEIAENTSVLIDGQNPGSGVIVAKQGKTYYVLTAKHVVKTEDEYYIITPDNQRYLLDYEKVIKIDNVDLAVIEFSSEEKYHIAQLGNLSETFPGMEVFIYGFPNPGREITTRIPQFTTGKITAKATELNDGYGLIYTNVTRAGMSGGPILNSSGQVVGIHGRAESENNPDGQVNESGIATSGKIGFNLGIPITTFVKVASKIGINLKSQNPLLNSESPDSLPRTPSSVNGVPSRPSIIGVPQENSGNNSVCAARICQ